MRTDTLRCAVACAAVACTGLQIAHAQPGPGPGLTLPPPPVPAGNPVTFERVSLGKTLFWDEQLSSTRTVACGTCHIPATGGSDPRSQTSAALATHPGPDGLFGTADDVTGSLGVPLNLDDGSYEWDAFFGIHEQITNRKAPTMINAAYATSLFWDGRATGVFTDPETGAVVLPAGAALESQAVGPPVSDTEMAHFGRGWSDIVERVTTSEPLSLVTDIPADLDAWIAGRDYPALFAEAFGDPQVTASRIAMALGAYQRTLVSNQSPIDTPPQPGQPPSLTPQEQAGRNVFINNGCGVCHAGALFSDNQFHYIGVRPQNDDLGRFNVTGAPGDRGAMRTPTLRNVELRGPYFHNGRFETLEEVIDFYDRGGDFDAPNKPALIRPLGLSPGQKAALAAFLRRPLTDPRVTAETAPFDRPTLYTEGGCAPDVSGVGTVGVAGTGGFTPKVIALEPPKAGNPNFTVGVYEGLGGANAVLLVDTIDPGAGAPGIAAAVFAESTPLGGVGAGAGYGSVSLALPDHMTYIGRTLIGRWYVEDAASPTGYATSRAFRFTIFDECGDPPCPGDVSGDGLVNFDDLNAVLDFWQEDVAPGMDGDANLSGRVDFVDLNIVLASWGGSCP